MKQNICMLVLNEVGSDPRVTKEAWTLSKSYHVSIIGMRNSIDVKRNEIVDGYEIFRVDNIKNRKGKKGAFRSIGVIRAICNKISAVLKIGIKSIKHKAEVYHAHDFEMLPVAYLAAKINKAKLVYDSHELWVEQRSDFPKWFKALVKLIEGNLSKKADLIITVNQSIAIELKDRYRLKDIPQVIYNYTPLSRVNIEPKQVNEQKIIALYHGGYIKDRGLEELIQAIEYFPPNVILQLRGMGPLEVELRKLAKPYMKKGQIQFCEPVPMQELVKAAAKADIGIIPYKPTCLNNYYSLPNKLSEYLMAGLAVSASNLPEIKKLNDEICFGELFNPNDPISIGSAISILVKDIDFLQKCKSNALVWSNGKGNWEKEGKKLEELYAKLLGEFYGQKKTKHLDSESV